jgi:hypothetical protein
MKVFINLKPAKAFAAEASNSLGVKPGSILQQINRNLDELLSIGAVYKTKGKSRLVDPEKFINWYLNH